MKKLVNVRFLLVGLILLILLRLFLNAYVPLMDKTEARYGEIARMMVETNNWVTPQIDYSIPFWAKPPLSTWLSAMSMKVFGINEFSARLPSLLISLVLLFIMRRFVKNKFSFYLVGFILMTTPEFILHAGVVSTDTALSFCIAMIFLSFWKAVNLEKKSFWGYLMFIFIGFGLLAKGPIVLILTAPPLFLWTLYFKEFRNVFRKIPWITGVIVCLIIALPWYIMAEQRTEGFIEYFIIGEHFKRFFDSDWHGDKYGYPKSQPIGMIWVFLLAFVFPWIQFLLIRLWRSRMQIKKDKWVVFLLFWLFWLPLFFTPSKSLIHTYILPSVVPIALLIINYWEQLRYKNLAIKLSLILPVAAIITVLLSLFNNNLEQYSNSDKYLVQNAKPGNNLYYFDGKSYSSQFYSNGEIICLSEDMLLDRVKNKENFNIIIEDKKLEKIDDSIINMFRVVASHRKNKLYQHEVN